MYLIDEMDDSFAGACPQIFGDNTRALNVLHGLNSPLSEALKYTRPLSRLNETQSRKKTLTMWLSMECESRLV